MIPKLCIVIGGCVVAIAIGEFARAVDETAAVTDRPTFTDEQIEFFEAEIRPVLVQHCYDCHSTDAAELQAGLYVDSREAMIKGGESGAAVVVGKPEESLLISAIKYNGIEMPPIESLNNVKSRLWRSGLKWGRHGRKRRRLPAFPLQSRAGTGRSLTGLELSRVTGPGSPCSGRRCLW